ncbi:MAG: DUF4079 domain-containing protein [Leptolyngbyaceae cyanobacterium MO_188.B28]|nr:DUF4079 domain-containing protein [Leptolyngbyaceae cyanobacterium MO_188.B28]
MSAETLEGIKPWLNFIHPILMFGLLGLTLYALYLGIQALRTRTASKDARKQLVKGKFGLRHYQIGAVLLALMVIGNISGMAVTYINNDKLFVDDHLIVGLCMTALIAIAAALVPFMQQGSDRIRRITRQTHLVLAVALVGLFGWETFTGVEILQRIIDNF